MKKEIKPLRLLVVEDNPGDQFLLKKFLQRSSVPVEEIFMAERLSKAASILEDQEVDLAFLDLTLPDSDGISSFVTLNKLLPYTPIIVLSGLSDLDAATETISLGAQDYLMKGEFDEKLLAKAIQYSIERKKTFAKLEESNERYEIVNKATGDVIWDWNLITNEIYISDRLKEIFGYEERHVMIDWALERIHPDDVEQVKALIAHCIETGTRSWETEYRFRASEGSYKFTAARGYTLFDSEGKAYRMIGSASDITERRRLEAELVSQQLNQQKLITEITIQAQEKEREDLARELHDNINQVLATVKMFLDMAKRDEKMRGDLVTRSYDNVTYAIEEIRKLSKSLVAPSLGDIGLMEALQELADEINLTREVKLELEYKGDEEQSLDPDLKLMLYRIVQEQINNIIKYSKASRAVIKLVIEPSAIFLSVSDNGIGFDPKQKAKGIGLKNIASRAEFYSGKMNIISAPGKGCTLEVIIPLKKN